MRPNLREQLQQLLQGRVCLMGLGNVEYGDDGFGVRLAEALIRRRGVKEVDRGRGAVSPSRYFDFGGRREVRWRGFRHAESSTTSSSWTRWNLAGRRARWFCWTREEMAARFPQISTHKISLGLLAKWVEANGRTKAWLLGVQPESLKPGEELTRRRSETTLERAAGAGCVEMMDARDGCMA